jgi:HlyD family secretion protein
MKKWINILIIIAVLALAALAVWQWQVRQARLQLDSYQTVAAVRGNLTSTIGATGVVHSNQTALLTWQTSGTVGQVNFELGDQVRAEQVLASLERTSLPQNVILAQIDLNNAEKALQELKNSQLAKTQSTQALLEARRLVIEAEQALVRFSEDRYKNELERAENRVVSTKKSVEDAEKAFEPYEDVDPENSVRKRLEKDLQDAQLRYEDAIRQRDLLLLQHDQAKAALEAAQARLADAEREVERLKNGPDPQDITNAEARIAAAQATLKLANVLAPFAGSITALSSRPGDRVAPGSVAFQIDDLSRLLVDVRISEVDINRVQVGQPATMTFDAIPGKQYQGVVMTVDRVGSSIQGVVDFTVTIELTDADEAVKPGMTSAVNIIVEQFENVLQVPNRAVRVQEGRRVVYILRNDQLLAVEIKLGASSELNSEVLEGNLSAGDLLVLNPPLVFEGNGPPPFVR